MVRELQPPNLPLLHRLQLSWALQHTGISHTNHAFKMCPASSPRSIPARSKPHCHRTCMAAVSTALLVLGNHTWRNHPCPTTPAQIGSL